mgnify:CR=1 FL=1
MFRCLAVGAEVVDALDVDLFIAGDMGIGNTTPATALLAAITGEAVEKLIGPGTGLDNTGTLRKRAVIEKALQRYGSDSGDWRLLLRSLGGLEIAAIAGAYLRCAQRGIPMLLDGFITGAAALVARQINESVTDWMLASHTSMEPGHQRMLEILQLSPLIDLQLRLGEASGAAVAVPLLQQSLALHARMSTFDEASVSNASS